MSISPRELTIFTAIILLQGFIGGFYAGWVIRDVWKMWRTRAREGR